MKDLLRYVFGQGASQADAPGAASAPAASEASGASEASAPTAPEASEGSEASLSEASVTAEPSAAPGAPSVPTPTAPASAVDPAIEADGPGGPLGRILGGDGPDSGGSPSNAGGHGGLMGLLSAILSLLGDRNGPRSGLDSVLGGLHANGFSHVADSWVGTGPNEAISSDQIVQCLGPDMVTRVAQEAGVPTEVASQGLASMLPDLVDHLTPGGQLPDSAGLDQALANLRRQVPVG